MLWIYLLFAVHKSKCLMILEALRGTKSRAFCEAAEMIIVLRIKALISYCDVILINLHIRHLELKIKMILTREVDNPIRARS